MRNEAPIAAHPSRVYGGLAAVAAAVDAVLADQLNRLKRFIETGRPD